MAFCAKCGTQLNDAGVCPSCGYVLPQSKRPVQQENAANETTVLGNQGNSYGAGAQPQNFSAQPYYGAGAPGNGVPGAGYGAGAPGNGAPGAGYGAGAPGNGVPGAGYGAGAQGNGVPGAGYGAQPGYGQQGSCGQPYYGQPYPHKSSDFGKNLLQWFLGIFKKDPTEIFDTVSASKSPVWAVYMAVYAFFGGLAAACSVGGFVRFFGSALNIHELSHIFGRASFSSGLITFIGAFLFYVGIMFLTSLIVWLVFMISGKKLPFWNACNVTVVAYIPSILASAFNFICSFTIFTEILAFVVSLIASIATLILLFCAIRRLAGDEKPIVWIYVIAQAVLKICTVIVAVIFIFIFAFILSVVITSSFW